MTDTTRQGRLWTRPANDAITEAAQYVDTARIQHNPRKTFVLFSGGNDSLVLLHVAMRNGWAPDGVIHVNTGIGIPDTTRFVRDVCNQWGLTLHELQPPRSYRQVFVDDAIIDGLPGPGMHHVAYSRLKERALRAFIKTQKRPGPVGWRDRIMLLTGIRADESVKRMGYSETVIEREGAKVWVNPLYLWTDTEMADYRTVRDLPRNPVSEHLHISGECLCGAFAAPGELEEIRFFWPHVAAEIEGHQAAAKAKGLTYWQWGQKRPGAKPSSRARLCTSCDARQAALWDAPTDKETPHAR